jgi:hypothetical protein
LRRIEKVTQPTCSKCGGAAWTVSEQEVQNNSVIDTMIQAGIYSRDEMVKVMMNLPKYKVRFIHCEDCGQVVNASVIGMAES